MVLGIRTNRYPGKSGTETTVFRSLHLRFSSSNGRKCTIPRFPRVIAATFSWRDRVETAYQQDSLTGAYFPNLGSKASPLRFLA
jgi:hypothetical protein